LPLTLASKKLILFWKKFNVESTYDAFITAILTSDEENNGEEDTAEKETPKAAAEGMEAGTPSNPIDLDTKA